MQTLLQPCKSVPLFNSSLPLGINNCLLKYNGPIHTTCLKSSSFHLFPVTGSLKALSFSENFPLWRSTHISFCCQNDAFDDFSSTQIPEGAQNYRIQENEELELLNKPSPVAINNGVGLEVEKESETNNKEEALAPFLKFFKPRDSLEEVNEEEDDSSVVEGKSNLNNEDKEAKKVKVDYYEPKPGDFVVGVVVSGNENKLDLNVGADLLGTMLTKEVLPLYDKEMEYLLCDMDKDAERFMVRGKTGIVKDEAAVSGGGGPGRPVVETGTILFAEVLGRTLSGRPLLSTRRLFRRIAWHRVRQVLFLLFSFAFGGFGKFCGGSGAYE